jgi:hypothetical protein
VLDEARLRFGEVFGAAQRQLAWQSEAFRAAVDRLQEARGPRTHGARLAASGHRRARWRASALRRVGCMAPAAFRALPNAWARNASVACRTRHVAQVENVHRHSITELRQELQVHSMFAR